MLTEKLVGVVKKNIKIGINLKELCNLLNYYHGGIYEKLKLRHPELSQKDIEICCLLIADFSSQQICALAKLKTTRSLYVRKSRMREKLNLKPNEKIEPYLKMLCESVKK